MIIPTKIGVLGTLFIGMFSAHSYAASDSGGSEMAYKGVTDIKQEAKIKLRVKSVKNIIDSTAGNNRGIVRVGSVRRSKINGKLDIDVNAGNITNKILAGKDNKAYIKMGAVEFSDINGDVDIDVITKDVNNTITKGNNNEAYVNIGSISNAKLKKVTLDVIIQGDVTNSIAGGNKNYAEVSLGAIN